MKSYDVVVIGAGSVGLPTAWALARQGLHTAVLDRHISAGRGQNRTAIGGIRATHSDPGKIELGNRSLRIVEALEAEHGFDVDWYRGGYLYPVYLEEHRDSLNALLEKQRRHGLDIQWVEPDEIQDLAPGLRSQGLLGGTWSPGDASASPLKVAQAFYRLALDTGVEFHFREEVVGLEQAGDRITAVRTDRNRYGAGTVVDASGALARATGRMAGLDVPVCPESHEGGITEPVRRFFRPMIVDIREDDRSANYYFYQNRDGQVVFCITPDPAIEGLDQDSTSTFLPLVIHRMLNLYPRLRNLRVRRTWRGLYPMTPDGFPIVHRFSEPEGPPGPRNLVLLVGMCGQGFMLGPGLGELVAESLAEGGDTHDAIFRQFRLDRDFTGQEMLL